MQVCGLCSALAIPENSAPALPRSGPKALETTVRDRDDFDDLRAERDMPMRQRYEANRFAGLWKQIALGIVVGYSVLGIVSAIAWLVIARIALSGLAITLP